MLDLLKLRKRHGRPVIKDIRRAEVTAPFRGFPLLREGACPDDCDACLRACPTGALSIRPLRLDLGACLFCGDCEAACPAGMVRFTPAHRLGASQRETLRIGPGETAESFAAKAIASRREIRRLFGRSLKLRQVSAAGCNGCEMELGACGNVNFDIGRFGVDFVASPRHADGLVLTGPISRNMSPALKDAYRSLGAPRIVVAVGACAIHGGLFAESVEVDRSFLAATPVDLFVPGCPPHPLTFIRAVLDFLGR
jgi:Ni,Fe-hydrogenase III small subunit/NAD-dependent dihydropyrimidine dehydrogenase PreA subunit